MAGPGEAEISTTAVAKASSEPGSCMDPHHVRVRQAGSTDLRSGQFRGPGEAATGDVWR